MAKANQAVKVVTKSESSVPVKKPTTLQVQADMVIALLTSAFGAPKTNESKTKLNVCKHCGKHPQGDKEPTATERHVYWDQAKLGGFKGHISLHVYSDEIDVTFDMGNQDSENEFYEDWTGSTLSQFKAFLKKATKSFASQYKSDHARYTRIVEAETSFHDDLIRLVK